MQRKGPDQVRLDPRWMAGNALQPVISRGINDRAIGIQFIPDPTGSSVGRTFQLVHDGILRDGSAGLIVDFLDDHRLVGELGFRQGWDGVIHRRPRSWIKPDSHVRKMRAFRRRAQRVFTVPEIREGRYCLWQFEECGIGDDDAFFFFVGAGEY